jgi:hypothetical protein
MACAHLTGAFEMGDPFSAPLTSYNGSWHHLHPRLNSNPSVQHKSERTHNFVYSTGNIESCVLSFAK